VTVSPGASLRTLRERKPLIHQITNYVVMNETANATLALGALPVMAHAPEEVEEMASVAGALVLNIGTLSKHWIEAMLLAGKAANVAGAPVVLDPVGAGATRLRTETAKRILDEVDVAVVRGNAAEVATLAGREAEIRGVESMETGGAELARAAAKALGCVASVTGPVDHVSDGTRTLAISNGDPMLATVSGTGCMSSAVTGSFLAVRADAPLEGAAEALIAFGVAGEEAAREAKGPGTFHAALYDALYALDPNTLDERARGGAVRLHAVVDDFEVASAALEGGATVLQLRLKGAGTDEVVDRGRSFRGLAVDHGATFIVNDDVEAARLLSADGVHLGRGDQGSERALELGLLLGRSAATVDEATQVEAEGAAYIGAGPVWETPSKPDADPAIGLEGLAAICRAVSIPVVAIGGIDETNAAECVAAGASGVAVVRAAPQARAILEALNRAAG